jgi:hypothetical protein
MSNGKRVPPALRHGAYSATALLPGENRSEFEKLHREITTELCPNGALEHDIIFTIARLVWRKQHLTTCRKAELAQKRLSAILSRCHDDEERASFPSRFDVIVKERKQAAEDEARVEFGQEYKFVEIGDAATLHGLNCELEVQGRLDAEIDKCLKRLLLLQGLKTLRAAPSSSPSQLLTAPTNAA